MTENPLLPPDFENNAEWDETLTRMATDLRYPPTPDIASRLRARRTRHTPVTMRMAQAAAVLVLLFAALMAVPQVRAEVSRILQIGVIRILLDSSTPTPTATAFATQEGSLERVTTSTPRPTDDGILDSVLELPGEISFEEAKEAFRYSILLPSYPPDLGEPDRVYYLEAGGKMMVMVWLDPDQAEEPLLSLFAFGPNSDVWKTGITGVTELMIDGRHAIWTEEPHLTEFYLERYGRIRRRVNNSVLIWFDSPVTYRVEGDFTLDEAKQIMLSLK